MATFIHQRLLTTVASSFYLILLLLLLNDNTFNARILHISLSANLSMNDFCFVLKMNVKWCKGIGSQFVIYKY